MWSWIEAWWNFQTGKCVMYPELDGDTRPACLD